MSVLTFKEWQETVFSAENFTDVSRKKMLGDQADFLEGASNRVDLTSTPRTPFMEAFAILEKETRRPHAYKEVDKARGMFGLFKRKAVESVDSGLDATKRHKK